MPYKHHHGGHSVVTYTKPRSQSYQTFLDITNKLRKSFWTYCIIGVASAIFAYILIGNFPTNFQKFAPKQRNDLQVISNNGNNKMIRNDKMAGKQELLKRGSGKKTW